MLVVRFGGGLGNQLFQYAFLLMLKQQNPDNDIICDTTTYQFFNEHNGFDLKEYFEFNERELDISELKRFKPVFYYQIKSGRKIKSLKAYNKILLQEKFLYQLRKRTRNLGYLCIEDHGNLMYNPGAIGKFGGKDCYFEGGWQSRYYYDFRYLNKAIRFKDIQLNNQEKNLERDILYSNSVAVHVRRGDFVQNKSCFDLCSMEYYQKAIDEVVTKSGLKKDELKFFMFSDDESYVKSTFDLPNMVIVKGQSAGNEMYLMSNAKYNITANSTFSFWAAMLNRKPELAVIPKYFVRSGGLLYKFDAPDGWCSVDNLI